jgi:hypothetical protein
VGPVVAEVEHVHELLAGAQPAQGGTPIVERLVGGVDVGVGPADPLPVGEGEFVEVGAVPAGKGVVDGGGELGEGVGAGGGQEPAGSGPEALTAPLDQLNANR